MQPDPQIKYIINRISFGIEVAAIVLFIFSVAVSVVNETAAQILLCLGATAAIMAEVIRIRR